MIFLGTKVSTVMRFHCIYISLAFDMDNWPLNLFDMDNWPLTLVTFPCYGYFIGSCPPFSIKSTQTHTHSMTTGLFPLHNLLYGDNKFPSWSLEHFSISSDDQSSQVDQHYILATTFFLLCLSQIRVFIASNITTLNQFVAKLVI
jgi:hypothetical protein